jgi:putative hydrolase of the HAD superfamily
MKFTAIVFDLFGTLVDSPSILEREKVMRNMASMLSIPLAEFTKEWDSTTNQRDTGTFPNFRSTLEYVCNKMSIDLSETQIEQVTRLRLDYFRKMLNPRKDAIDVLNKLRKLGYKTGLISDCSCEVPTIWKETALASLFDQSIFSCSEGVKKPDPRIYQILTSRLEVFPADCLYVGDGGSRELTGASRIGMKAVLIRMKMVDSAVYVTDKEQWDGPAIESLPEVLKLAE